MRQTFRDRESSSAHTWERWIKGRHSSFVCSVCVMRWSAVAHTMPTKCLCLCDSFDKDARRWQYECTCFFEYFLAKLFCFFLLWRGTTQSIDAFNSTHETMITFLVFISSVELIDNVYVFAASTLFHLSHSFFYLHIGEQRLCVTVCLSVCVLSQISCPKSQLWVK